jgi:K+-transporting ATPase ATPase C chain
MALLIFTVLTGLLYPLVVTGIAQLAFPRQANGSLIVVNGKTVGSSLIGQQFTDPSYFWGRLSATGPYPYNASSSSGSNLGPTNPALLDEAKARIAALKAADPGNTQPIPVDLVTSSGSGLDPAISVAAALYQLPRVARLRGLSRSAVRALVDKYTQGRTLGFLGEPTVNVLQLNLALDGLKP